MSRFLDLLIGFAIIIMGVIIALLFYPFFLSISNGAIFIVVLLIPILFGIVGIGWSSVVGLVPMRRLVSCGLGLGFGSLLTSYTVIGSSSST